MKRERERESESCRPRERGNSGERLGLGIRVAVHRYELTAGEKRGFCEKKVGRVKKERWEEGRRERQRDGSGLARFRDHGEREYDGRPKAEVKNPNGDALAPVGSRAAVIRDSGGCARNYARIPV